MSDIVETLICAQEEYKDLVQTLWEEVEELQEELDLATRNARETEDNPEIAAALTKDEQSFIQDALKLARQNCSGRVVEAIEKISDPPFSHDDAEVFRAFLNEFGAELSK